MKEQTLTNQDAPDDARLDPRNGILSYSVLTNPDCGLTVRMRSSPYGGDGYHVSWGIDAFYKASLTATNAMDTVPLAETGPRKKIHALYGIGVATQLLKLTCSQRYPDENLWLFVKSNAVRVGHPAREMLDEPLDGPFSAEQILQYTLQASIHLMREQELWKGGDFRLFIPIEIASRLSGRFGERLRPRNYGEKDREYCEVLFDYD